MKLELAPGDLNELAYQKYKFSELTWRDLKLHHFKPDVVEAVRIVGDALFMGTHNDHTHIFPE